MSSSERTSGESVAQRRTFWLGMILTLSASALWGSAYPGIQIALSYYNAYEISFLRAVFGTLTLLFYYALRRKKGVTRELVSPPRSLSTWVLLIILAFLGAAGFWTFLNLSVLFLQADTSSFILALYPFLAILLASVFLKERLTVFRVVGVCIGILGTYLIVSFGESAQISGAQPLIGILLALLASFAFAGYIVETRVMLGRKDPKSGFTYSPHYITLMTFLISIPPTFVISVATTPLRQMESGSIVGISTILYLGILASGVAFLIFNMGTKMIGVNRASTNLLIFPAVSVILSYLLLGERINIGDVIGMVLIFIGIVVAQRVRELQP